MSGWRPTTCFTKIMRLNKRVKSIYGGSSSGKTFNILAILYQRALDNPGEVITVASNTLANLKKGAVRDLKNILVSRNAWDPNCWMKSDSQYNLNNGSVIEFIGLEDETKARGPRRDRLFVDEANRISFEVYQQLERRTRKEVLLSWNPSGAFWWNEHMYGKMDMDVLVTNFKDNEALDEMQLEMFRNMELQSTQSDYMMNQWKVYGLGEWGKLEGACINTYEIVDDIPDGFKLEAIGLDFGVNDPNAAIALYKHQEHGRFLFDEILYKPNMQISQIAKALKGYDSIIYADYSWKQNLIELNKRGLTVHPCKKGPNSIQQGIDLINENNPLVTRRSENLLTEFDTYAYKRDKDGNLEDGKFEGPDHAVDAARYVLAKSVKKRTFRVI